MESDLLMIMDSAGDDREALAGGGCLMTLPGLLDVSDK